MDFLQECHEYFGSKCLYLILGIEKTAKENEIKSAYRKKSLKVHPDRATEDRKEHAKRAFQVLTKVHYVLTSENLRKVYDDTGMVITNEDSEFASFSSFEEYENYWRTLFPKITTKQIDDYLAKYVGSEEEKSDLKDLYIRFEGDMNKIYEYHYAYDEDRIVNILNELIEAEIVPEFDAFVNESKAKKQKRLKRIAKEQLEAEVEKKNIDEKKQKAKNGNASNNDGNSDLSALALAIQNNRKKREGDFDNMISSLEAKYGAKNEKNKKTRSKKK